MNDFTHPRTPIALLDEFLAGQPAVSAPHTVFGTTSFMHLRKGGVERFLLRLRTDYETSVAPGRFFEMPSHFRVGMGVNSAMFGEGLRRLGLDLAVCE